MFEEPVSFSPRLWKKLLAILPVLVVLSFLNWMGA
jgi:hypothetical protein